MTSVTVVIFEEGRAEQWALVNDLYKVFIKFELILIFLISLYTDVLLQLFNKLFNCI